MKADFLDAHERHWHDAQRLLTDGRWANADHLYGIAAECGLKRLMIQFGMEINPSSASPKEKKDRVHANQIWPRFESYLSGKAEGAGFALPANNPFNDWDISDRYVHQSEFNKARVLLHQVGSQTVRDLIAKAKREGLIS